jgi:hypothetical protein
MYRFEQTGELVARADDGHEYRVAEFTKFLNLADASTPTRWEPVDHKEYRLGGGERVIIKSDGNLLIVGRKPKVLRITSHKATHADS